MRIMGKLATWLLRADLVLLLLGSVLAQVIVPAQASLVGASNPEVAYLVVPYSAAAILFIVCGQVALIVVLRLLSLVDRGAVFSRPAVRWVDVIAACAAIATALSTGVLVHMLAFVPGGGGPAIYSMAFSIAGGLAVGLAMVILHGLLETVIAERARPDGAI
jgi:hypothetical protein